VSVTWIEGIPFGSGMGRTVVPESRTIRLVGPADAGSVKRASGPAERTSGPPGASAGLTKYGDRRGRPRKNPPPTGELPPALLAFLAACERTAVEGVVLRQTLRDALDITDSTLNVYASKCRSRGLFPYRIGGTPRHHDMRTRGAAAKAKGGGA
jgi:hypothetical protein